jgi:hypothetical protein
MLDIVAVKALAASLAPALPYLLGVGGKIVEGAARAVGADSWTWAKSVWNKLGPRVNEEPATLKVFTDVAEDPKDELAQSALIYHLKKLLDADPSLAEEMQQLLRQGRASNVVVTGERAVGIGGNVTHSHITTGDQTSAPRTTQGGSAKPPAKKAKKKSR